MWIKNGRYRSWHCEKKMLLNLCLDFGSFPKRESYFFLFFLGLFIFEFLTNFVQCTLLQPPKLQSSVQSRSSLLWVAGKTPSGACKCHPSPFSPLYWVPFPREREREKEQEELMHAMLPPTVTNGNKEPILIPSAIWLRVILSVDPKIGPSPLCFSIDANRTNQHYTGWSTGEGSFSYRMRDCPRPSRQVWPLDLSSARGIPAAIPNVIRTQLDLCGGFESYIFAFWRRR